MTAPIRVLVIDDDFAVAHLHRQFVDAHDKFEVVAEAHTGAAALDAIDRLNPDLVLLDFYLPDFSGLEVLSRLRVEQARYTEVIAVTAARDIASVRQARANGIRHYLIKPFTATALRERLDEVARSYQTLDSVRRVETLSQNIVDNLILGTHQTRALPPKGLSAATLELVSRALATAPADLSAAEVAEIIGMSRVGARRYLEHLVHVGTALVEPRYGSTGRPVHRYRAR
ncbi:response regulator [Salinibacterium sp. NK8237]|uniref:response regulator n=1 Tax=Salinibacterium sp. NK8237 TaxID=2792038 RepID=UPI0018CEDC85|nr:response regulator [Salinibacterium sp. NK8237]MBH0131574.1 response regulator [Salinibacterium sp. NK8237]